MEKSTPFKRDCEKTTWIEQDEDDNIKDFNCLELPLEQVKFILGPCVFYEFEIGTRKIYMFGERHGLVSRSLPELTRSGVNRYNSLSFQGFVHSLATQNPTKTYDLVFENAYFDEFVLSQTSSAVFNQISRQFVTCIKHSLRHECPYKNLRTHYADFRKYKPKGGEPLSDTANPQNIKEIMKELLSSKGKVLKQIKAIKDDKIRNSVIDYFTEFVTKYPEVAGFAAAVVMDVYAIARILRDFDSKKKGGASSFEGTAENVIYYAGIVHIENFVRFLTDYLHLKPKVVRGISLDKLKTSSDCSGFVDMIDMKSIGLTGPKPVSDFDDWF